MCSKQMMLTEAQEDLVLEVLSRDIKFKAVLEKTEDVLKFEYNLVGGKISEWVDGRVKEVIEGEGPDWKWYAQGTDLQTGRRDICFERVWLVPDEIEG